jgi:hypothetical protein
MKEPRDLFDGKSLQGWHAVPRLPAPAYPGDKEPDTSSERYRGALANPAVWSVQDGAIIGEQAPGGGGFGGYLVSDEVFADFELILDAQPDWPADTGVLVRATGRGSQGFQVLVDHRKSGGIGGFYGNGIGGFHALSYNVDVRYGADRRPVALIEEDPATTLEPVTAQKRGLLGFAAPPASFFGAWRWGSWNTFRIRCEGRYPVLTTWVNEVQIYQMDTGSTQHPHYDREAVAALLGRGGYIALEVHDTDRLGELRWGPGARCRWRNIRITEL